MAWQLLWGCISCCNLGVAGSDLLLVALQQTASMSAQAPANIVTNPPQAAAQKTADLLAEWHALTPTFRDQPAALQQIILKPSPTPKCGLEASGNALTQTMPQSSHDYFASHVKQSNHNFAWDGNHMFPSEAQQCFFLFNRADNTGDQDSGCLGHAAEKP